MKSKGSSLFLLLGVLLICAACFLAGYNFATERNAGDSSEMVLSALTEAMNPAEPVQPERIPVLTRKKEPVLPLPELELPPQVIPDYELNPDMPMPTAEVDGMFYIGVLSIPALGLRLPIAAEWSYPVLRSTPARYYGSAYTDDLVIAAHNYASHFGNLIRLQPGDAVEFVDMDGNLFSYTVVEIETLEATAIEEMNGSTYPLTLFTCTVGGQARVACRCEYDD